MIPRLDDDPNAPFPPVSRARDFLDGLLACGGDLHPQRLLNAYRQGIFPWYSEGQPILWWWPQPRMVLLPGSPRLSRRFLRTLRQHAFTVTADRAFEDVVAACAGSRPGQQGTWITRDMQQAYCRLFELGHAHSVEVWRENELIGGIYGIALGRVFFGESMFSRRRDGSKIALANLCRHLWNHDFALLDCQLPSEHLSGMGAVTVEGEQFQAILAQNTGLPDPIGDWSCVIAEPLDWNVE